MNAPIQRTTQQQPAQTQADGGRNEESDLIISLGGLENKIEHDFSRLCSDICKQKDGIAVSGG
jgi:hypothetical protein